MNSPLQSVLRFAHHQATTPYQPVRIQAAQQKSAKDAPPFDTLEEEEEEGSEEDEKKKKDDEEQKESK